MERDSWPFVYPRKNCFKVCQNILQIMFIQTPMRIVLESKGVRGQLRLGSSGIRLASNKTTGGSTLRLPELSTVFVVVHSRCELRGGMGITLTKAKMTSSPSFYPISIRVDTCYRVSLESTLTRNQTSCMEHYSSLLG